MSTPSDALLDELFDNLAGTGGTGRRALAEAEDHLRSAVAEARARGLDPEAAEVDAVRRFGSAAAVATGIRRAHLDRAGIVRGAFVGTWLIGAVSLIAIGISGGVAELFGRLFGAVFVAGDSAGVTYTSERCADYFEYVPDAPSCADAAAVHHWGEVVQYRVVVGVLGLLALLALWAARKTVLRGPRWTQPTPYVATVLLAMFALAAAGLGGTSLMELAFGLRSGVGANLSAGIVAALVALGVLGWALRRVWRAPHLARS